MSRKYQHMLELLSQMREAGVPLSDSLSLD